MRPGLPVTSVTWPPALTPAAWPLLDIRQPAPLDTSPGSGYQLLKRFKELPGRRRSEPTQGKETLPRPPGKETQSQVIDWGGGDRGRIVGRAHANGYRSGRPCTGRGCPRSGSSPSRIPTSRSPSRPPAIWLPARRDELGGRRRGRRRRRGQRRRGERAAPRGRRGPARRGQARAVREAAGAERDRRQAMVAGPGSPTGSPRSGFIFRRSPAINAVREQVPGGPLGPAEHFSGRYWCDYGVDPDAPMSWRYRGGPAPARSRTSAATWSTSASSSAGRWRGACTARS